MKFLIDAQLPPVLARWIANQGHVAFHVVELGMEAVDDAAIWDHARREKFVIVSKDEDFVDRWIKNAEGVALVWIRKGNCSNPALIDWLDPLWAPTLRRLEQGDRFVELRA